MHLTPTAGFQNINFDIWKQIVEGGLYKYSMKALKSVKDPGNTFNLAKSGQELCRSWYIFYGIFIEIPSSTIFFQISELIIP
jgi:hypothetical protein